MNSKKKRVLVVVFRNPQDINKRATLILRRSENYQLSTIRPYSDGDSAWGFLQRYATKEQAIKLFPGCFKWIDRELTYQSLPMNPKGLRPLANLVGMPVIATEFDKFIDEHARFLFRVDPSPKTKSRSQ